MFGMAVAEPLFVIRSLEASDHAAYVALVDQFRPPPTGFTAQMDFEAVRRDVLASGRVWVCAQGAELVGTVTVHVEQKFIHGGARYARVEDLFVAPKWRNRGLAGMLLDEALRYCRDPVNRIRKVSLTCADELAPFYERHGFSNRQNDVSLLTEC